MTTTTTTTRMMSGDAQQKIASYLGRLRAGLRGVNDEDIREIVQELRGHILDKAAANGDESGAGVAAVLVALGSPEELASEYLTDNLLARAEVSRSPVQLLKSLFRLASLSVAGFFVLLGSTLGYFSGVVFVLVAMLKSFHPHTAGLWLLPGASDDIQLSFRLGFGTAPAGAKDVLGWWIVPIGWMVGGGLMFLTTHLALWFVRRCRKSLILPRGQFGKEASGSR